jgi:hypothetical protein
MAGSDLTPKQQQALDAFKDGGDVKDVAKAMSITNAGAYSHIVALKKKGYIDADGRLTTKAVIGKVTTAAAPAPEVPEAPAVEAPTPTVNGDAAMNGDHSRHASFDLDKVIVEGFAQRRQELATTVDSIEKAISAHEERVQALDAERAEHAESLKTLAATHDQALKALSALPVEQPQPVAA